MAINSFSLNSVKAYLLTGVFVSIIALDFFSAEWPGNRINGQEFTSTQTGNTNQLEVTSAQLSADSGDSHNYAKHEHGHYRTTQIARGHSERCFKTLNKQLAIRNIFLPLRIKLAALPASLVAEQQCSISVLLRRLLI